MDDIKKFIKKIIIKLKYLKRTIDYINSETLKNKIFIFFDILWCKIRYFTNSNEYRIFEFYNIKSNKRKTYLNTFYHNRYKKYISDKKIINVLEDKKLFNLRFKDYLKREVINVHDLSFKEYEDLCLNNKKLICRSSNSNYLKSYKVYDLKNYRSPAYMIEEIKKDNKVLIEKNFKKHALLDLISDELVIINITTLNDKDDVKIISSSIKFYEDEIISGYINPKTGKIKGHLKDYNGLNYKREVINYEIPKYKEIISLAKKLSKELEEIKEVEWSFTVNSRGTIYLLDGNIYDDFIFNQTPEFLNNREGFLNIYKKAIKKIRGF